MNQLTYHMKLNTIQHVQNNVGHLHFETSQGYPSETVL